MWLLDANTRLLHSFVGKKIPQYAILSHTWEGNEVSFKIFQDCGMVVDGLSALSEDEQSQFPFFRELVRYRQKRLETVPGWQKILNFCKKTLEQGLRWAWIDTVCIDKSSSAELQEAINSMYSWYQRARLCFVYMSDVSSHEQNERMAQFHDSRWFTRGWTLQELLAPSLDHTTFFDHSWGVIGTGNQLLRVISHITKIPVSILRDVGIPTHRKILNTSIAKRMSWAAARKVTRSEDMAYSLLGVFDCNMPLLYGEGGKKAFERLQQEIIKNSNDETIFAWMRSKEGDACIRGRSSILAESPSDFAGCSNIEQLLDRHSRIVRPFWTSQLGIVIKAPLISRDNSSHYWFQEGKLRDFNGNFFLPLRCLDTISRETFVLVLSPYQGGNGMETSWYEVSMTCRTYHVPWNELNRQIPPNDIEILKLSLW